VPERSAEAEGTGMALVLTTAGREIRRRLASAMLAGLARGADRKIGLAVRVVESLPFFPLSGGVGRALSKKLVAGDHALVGFIARLGRELSERSMEKFVTNLLVNAWVDGRSARERFRREEGFYPPNFIVVSPTMRCNFRCDGCWAAAYEHVPNMDVSLLEHVIAECKEDLGVRFFTIAGGEPFIRSDLLDLYERHEDCYFQVYTNGVLIDEEVAARLGEMGNVAPMLSVEGGRDSTDRRRGPGTYDRLVEVRSLLSGAGVLHGFAVTATRDNVYEISSDEFVDEMIEQGALAGWYFHYMPIGADPDPARMITAAQRDHLRKRVYEIRNSRPIFAADFWNDGPAVQGCMAGGRRYLHINPNGDIEPCVFVHFAVDNVRETTIREALRSPFMRAIREGAPYDGNLLRPCMIIDRPEVLRRHCRAHGARPTHPGASNIVSELADALDQGAAAVAGIMDGVWARGEWQHLYVTAEEIAGRGDAVRGLTRPAEAAFPER
jgi:MoaA/NifB/PqqE/SkfB family radical SAM enzyme